jgi:hypothetical protein
MAHFLAFASVSTRERQGHQSRCHGLSTFLAELAAFGIGKVEILQ